jgi:cell division protein FtsI/penicillin-binding protein 2
MAPLTIPSRAPTSRALRTLPLALPLSLVTAANPQPNSSLLAQTIQSTLTQRWPPANNPHLSWLVLDTTTGQLLAQQWPALDQPIPVGSLTKPFLALAYAATHTTFPHITCYGTQGLTPTGQSADRCWLRRGHGQLNIQIALANSCNAYFLGLSRDIDPTALQTVIQTYNLPAPPPNATPATLIGLNTTWQIPPIALARAYAQLASQPNTQPGTELILTGLHLATQQGTASALRSSDALAKTGTAPCQHHCAITSDGLVIALTPAAAPRILLLVRQQGATGAATATIAAQMLDALKVHDAEPQ